MFRASFKKHLVETHTTLKFSTTTLTTQYSPKSIISAPSLLKDSLIITNIEKCLFSTNHQFRAGKEEEFTKCLKELRQHCSQLRAETESNLDGKLWNFLIQHYCRNELFNEDALFWFKRIMKERKIANANGFTLGLIIKVASERGDVELCEEVLEELEEKGQCDVYSYIYYTKACLMSGNSEKAFNVIERMEKYQVEPSFGIYIPLLKEAAKCGNKRVGLKLYHMILKSNLNSSQLSYSIANFALKVKMPEIAIKEYEKLKKNEPMMMTVITWTCLIQAYIQNNEMEKACNTLLEMEKKGIHADATTYNILLTGCANAKLIKEGLRIHEMAKKNLKEFTSALSMAVINFYSKCGHSEIVIQECELLKMKGSMNAVAWNSLIQAYIRTNEIEKAINVLCEMKEKEIQIDQKIFIELLRSCANTKSFKEGMKIYEIAKEYCKEFNMELSNALVNFYNKCNHPELAIQECEALIKKGCVDVVTWTCLIQSFIQTKEIEKAIEILCEMGNIANSTTYNILLTGCANAKLFKEGKKVHELAKLNLKEFTVRLANSILNFYNKCEHPEIAIHEFEEFNQRGLFDVITFNCLIHAHIQNNQIDKAIDLVVEMEKKEIHADATTYTILLSGCANSKLFKEGVRIQEMAKQNLKEFSIELSSSVLNFYNKCDHPEIAIQEFQELRKRGSGNVVSWTCLIQSYVQTNEIEKAIEILMEINNIANSTTYIVLLTGCANLKLFEEGKKAIEMAKQNLDVFSLELSNTILNFYNKCRHSNLAIREFQAMKQKGSMNVVAYNCLIQANIQNNEIEKAIETLCEMRNIANSTTYNILLTGCTNSKLFKEGVRIHELAKQNLKEFSIELSNAILNFYNKSGHPETVIQECEAIKQKGSMDIISWTCLIQAYIQISFKTISNGSHGLQMAFSTYQEMKDYVEPDLFVFHILLSACGEYVASSLGIQIIQDIKCKGIDKNDDIISAMVYFYSRIGQDETAQLLFNELLQRQAKRNRVLSVTTYGNMLACYSHSGKGKEAQLLFNEMVENQVELNEVIFIILLNTYSHCGMVDDAIQLHSDMKFKYNISSTISIDCAMVDVFSRAGRFEEAELLINNRINLDLWGALLGGCRKFNNIEMGEKVFNKMTSIDDQLVSPYILLSHIYSYHGLDERANHVKDLMKKRGIKKQPGIVTFEENGTVYEFISGSQNSNEKVEEMRDEIYKKIIKAGFVPNTTLVANTKYITKEEKVKSLSSHAEKMAISHALVMNPNRKEILLTSNFRICNDCHNAMTFISKVMNIEIIIRDSNRYHRFRNGKCNCGDYW